MGAVRVASALDFSSVAIWASTAATRARAASISSRREPAFKRATVAPAAVSRARTAARRSLATFLCVAASSRCFCDPELDCSRRSNRWRSVSAADRSAWAAATSAAAAAACASACLMSSGREPACNSRSCASACARSASARFSARSASRESRRAMRAPRETRSPS